MDNNLNLGDILGKLSSNPEIISQISSLAGLFTNAPAQSTEATEETAATETIAATSEPSQAAFGYSPNGVYPQTRAPFPSPPDFKNYHEYGTHHKPDKDGFEHAELFNALRPYLNDRRKETLDYILQIFKLIKALEASGINIGAIFNNFLNNCSRGTA
jgi:hypothetical protein